MVAASRSRREAGAQRHLLVRCGSVRCGIPLVRVRQVLRELVVHPVPGSDPLLLGLGQYAGEALAVLDLRRLLGLDAAPPGEQHLAVLVVVGPEGHGETVAFAVDDAEQIVVIPDAAISEVREGAVRGEAEIVGRMVRVLDPAAVGAA